MRTLGGSLSISSGNAAYQPLVTHKVLPSTWIPGTKAMYRSPERCEKKGIVWYSRYVKIPASAMALSKIIQLIPPFDVCFPVYCEEYS